MEKELTYTEFKFNEYFERYIKKIGISRAFNFSYTWSFLFYLTN